jgi:acetyltransferase-like isoleucine patch superfamily enzyme
VDAKNTDAEMQAAMGNTFEVECEGVHLTTDGMDNYLKIGKPLSAGNVRIHLAGGARVSIDDDCTLGHLFIHAVNGSRVHIGKGAMFNGFVRLLLHETQQITVGDGCLFAGNVDVTVSDMHSILDMETGERINHAGDVHISERVWVGQSAIILKGVSIGRDSVIGANSVVTRDVPANCIAAGNPAKVIRRGITWRHDLI